VLVRHHRLDHDRCTPREAVALGTVLTVTHTAAVLAPGGAILLLVTAAPVLSWFTDRRSAWLTARLPLLSAAMVTVLGGAMALTGVSGPAG
jgi:hypothetical protein